MGEDGGRGGMESGNRRGQLGKFLRSLKGFRKELKTTLSYFEGVESFRGFQKIC